MAKTWLQVSHTLVAWFDTNRVIDQVVDITSLNIVEDNTSGVSKGLIDIVAGFGRRLEEEQTIALGELDAFFIADLALVSQIKLVSDQDDCHPVVGVLQ